MRPRSKTTRTSILSDSVKKLREAAGVTQEEFAKGLGVTLNTVARWETFRSPSGIPNLLKLRKIAEHYELFDLDDIFYSALLQESPSHRFGYVGTINAKASSMRLEIVELACATKDMELRDKLLDFGKELGEISRVVNLLCTTTTRLPAGEVGTEDYVRVMAPDLIAGQLKHCLLDRKTIATQTEAIAQKVAKKTSKKKATKT